MTLYNAYYYLHNLIYRSCIMDFNADKKVQE